MRGLLAAVILALLPAAAAAQWRVSTPDGGVRAFVETPDGASLILRCAPGPEFRGNLVLELIVRPRGSEPDSEEVATLIVGNTIWEFETLPVGRIFGNRVMFRSQFDFFQREAIELREDLAAGSVAVLEDAFDFFGTRFGLNGSRVAITRLERDCPGVWQRGAQPAPAPSGRGLSTRWEDASDPLIGRILTRGPSGLAFGIECPVGQPTQTRWLFSLGVTRPDIDDPSLSLVIDGRPFAPFDEIFAAAQTDPGLRTFGATFDPVVHAGIIAALRAGAARVDVPSTTATTAASFDLDGFSEVFGAIIERCGFAGPPNDGVPGGGRDVTPEALEAFRASIFASIQDQCAPGAPLTLPQEAVQAVGARVTVQPGLAQCNWSFGVNPYCGASRCQVWVYGFDGAQFALIEEGLR